MTAACSHLPHQIDKLALVRVARVVPTGRSDVHAAVNVVILGFVISSELHV